MARETETKEINHYTREGTVDSIHDKGTIALVKTGDTLIAATIHSSESLEVGTTVDLYPERNGAIRYKCKSETSQ